MTDTSRSNAQTFLNTVEQSLDSALLRLDDAANLKAMLANVEKQIHEVWPEIESPEQGRTVSADNQLQLSAILDKINLLETKRVLGLLGQMI